MTKILSEHPFFSEWAFLLRKNPRIDIKLFQVHDSLLDCIYGGKHVEGALLFAKDPLGSYLLGLDRTRIVQFDERHSNNISRGVISSRHEWEMVLDEVNSGFKKKIEERDVEMTFLMIQVSGNRSSPILASCNFEFKKDCLFFSLRDSLSITELIIFNLYL